MACTQRYCQSLTCIETWHDLLRSVERYDPARNAWVKVKPMSVGRRSPGVAAHRGKLYAVGGMGEKEDLRGPIQFNFNNLLAGFSKIGFSSPVQCAQFHHENSIQHSDVGC